MQSQRKVTILLVEDHVDTASAMRKLLSYSGYGVETAGSVAGALKAVDEQNFDLLISDIGLPDGSGLDLMRELLQRPREKPICGIALSGYTPDDDGRASKEAGFTEYLTKPVNFSQLEAAIDRAIQALNQR